MTAVLNERIHKKRISLVRLRPNENKNKLFAIFYFNFSLVEMLVFLQLLNESSILITRNKMIINNY